MTNEIALTGSASVAETAAPETLAATREVTAQTLRYPDIGNDPLQNQFSAPNSTTTVFVERHLSPAEGSASPWIDSMQGGDIFHLAQIVTIENKNEVLKYLKANSDLVRLLTQSFLVITKEFGSGDHPVLEIVTDPNSSTPELICRIETALPFDTAISALERFDDNWWLDYAATARGRLNFDISFNDVDL